MFREGMVPKKTEKVNILIKDGGIGDLIGALVAVDYNVRNYPFVQFLIWVPDYLVELAKHVIPGESIRPFSEGEKHYNESLPGVSTGWEGQFHTPMRTHPVDYAFHKLVDKHIYDLNEKNYLQIKPDKVNLKKFHLPEKYVVLSASTTENVKRMPIETFNAIVDFVIEKGYTPVFLGKTTTDVGTNNLKIYSKPMECDFSKGINLINKTTLLESAAVIAGAKCIVGMDGGLIHLAGMTMTEIVAGYTFVNPEHLAPIRYGMQCYKYTAIVPDESLKCRFCQTNVNFIYGHDFRDCFYKDWECTKQMTAEKFIRVLKDVI